MILAALARTYGDDAVGLSPRLHLSGGEDILAGGLVPMYLEEERIRGRAYRYGFLLGEGIPPV